MGSASGLMGLGLGSQGYWHPAIENQTEHDMGTAVIQECIRVARGQYPRNREFKGKEHGGIDAGTVWGPILEGAR